MDDSVGNGFQVKNVKTPIFCLCGNGKFGQLLFFFCHSFFLPCSFSFAYFFIPPFLLVSPCLSLISFASLFLIRTPFAHFLGWPFMFSLILISLFYQSLLSNPFPASLCHFQRLLHSNGTNPSRRLFQLISLCQIRTETSGNRFKVKVAIPERMTKYVNMEENIKERMLVLALSAIACFCHFGCHSLHLIRLFSFALFVILVSALYVVVVIRFLIRLYWFRLLFCFCHSLIFAPFDSLFYGFAPFDSLFLPIHSNLSHYLVRVRAAVLESSEI